MIGSARRLLEIQSRPEGRQRLPGVPAIGEILPGL